MVELKVYTNHLNGPDISSNAPDLWVHSLPREAFRQEEMTERENAAGDYLIGEKWKLHPNLRIPIVVTNVSNRFI